MKKNISLIIATLAAAGVIFVGVRSFACDRGHKTANAQGTATYALETGALCPYSGTQCSSGSAAKMAGTGGCCAHKTANADLTANGTSTCGSHANWTASLCGSKGYYAANVYRVQNGHMWAVCQGKTFEVNEATPFVQMDEARYYFADEASKIRCHEMMKATAPAIDREVVSLATAEANVVDVENGRKIAQCPVTGHKFVVTADSPARVVDGQKYYMSVEQDLSTISAPAHQ
jgi:hypothetical protein